MARQNVDIGVQGNDGTGDSIRESFRKVNENFIQLFAVFGDGDTISFKDLDDTPDNFPNGIPRTETGPSGEASDADKVVISNADANALVAKSLVGGEGIEIDHTDENEIRIISTGGKVGTDIKPQLGGHLNAQNFSIGNLANPSDEVAALFNDLHDTDITADNLAITKGYADQRYLQASGGPGSGGQIRVRDMPEDASEYTILIDLWSSGYAVIENHGFNSGSNGIAYKYFITGSTPATGLTEGDTYYLRYVDKNRLSLHETPENARDGIARIIVNDPEVPSGSRGVETIVDANYDDTLEGNWVSNEALPRKSVVRRQGDRMDGPLFLQDHPGSLAGQGSPNGSDDLQAATKFYVDNSSFASQANLFVANSGDDAQTNTPPGKEGRAFAYAYSTVNAACAKAEEIIDASLKEPGPYRQVLTYGNNNNIAYLETVTTSTASRRNLNVWTNGGGVDQSRDINNRDLREGSIIKGLQSGATGKVIRYTPPSSLTDGYLVELLHDITDVTYFQTDFKYTHDNLLSNKEFIQSEVVEFVKAKYPSLVFNETKCFRDAGLIVDAVAFDIKYGGNTKTIRAGRAYWNGVTSVLPTDQLLPTVDAMEYLRELATEIIDNNLITAPAAGDIDGPGRFGKRSTLTQYTAGELAEDGALTMLDRFVDVIINITQYGESGNGTFLEFIAGEQLEFGQLVPETQITVRVESGIYYEQLPIRVPTNVSIKGDEFRRSIIRPAPGVSTSKWANLFFYRDSTFDGITRTYISNALAATSAYNAVDDQWEVTLSTGTVAGLQVGMYLFITGGTGTFTPASRVTRILSTTKFAISEEPITTLAGATIRGLNGEGLAPTGQNFGYHYLTDPSGISGTFSTTPAAGSTVAAGLLNSNRALIQDEVIRYINAKYPTLVYNQTLCSRDVGYIVDALVYDITNGGVSRSLAAGQSYRSNASALVAITEQLTETLDGIGYIDALAQRILDNITITAPATPTGFGKRGTIAQASGGAAEAGSDTSVQDLVNGVKNVIIGTNNPPKANKDMDVFLLNDGTILRNITAQGHGGFMCVLDPEGQIQTKSPYFQTATCLSGSVNKKSFRGGMLIDGFSGNLPARIISKNSATEIVVDGLTVRAPGVPNSFYITGARYQLNSVEDYNRSTGTATLTLDASTPYNDAVTVPLDIIIETPGNRSMLANDFTQVNDLGYGIVATNNGISEAVSVFTYYNQVSYYANTGGQIRSLNGSSCNGIYGLKASGSDPNEVPDPVVLSDDMVKTARIFKRSTFASKNNAADQSIYIDYYPYASGTTQPAIYNVSELEIDHSNTKSSVVENTATITTNIQVAVAGTGYAVNDLIEAVGGTLFPGGLKATFKVTEIDNGATGGPGAVTDVELIEAGSYSVNPVGGYPIVRGSFTTAAISGAGINAEITASFLGNIERYEVSNLEVTSTTGEGVNSGGVVSTRAVIKLNLNASSATAGLRAPLQDGQIVNIRSLQNFRFSGVERVKPVRPSTALQFIAPEEDDSVYRTLSYNLAYPTGATLLSSKSIATIARNASIATISTGATPHGISSGDYANITCTTDSSFDAVSVQITIIDLYTFTYINGGVNVGTTPATGTVSYGNQAILSFDTSFDYVIVQTDPTTVSTVDPDSALKTMGATAGDTKIAIATVAADSVNVDRLNTGNKRIILNGRMHVVTGYVAPSGLIPAYITISDVAYGAGTIIDPAGVGVSPTGLVAGINTYRSDNIRAGLPSGEAANITVNISTCRATGHDFLDIGSGGFNSTNYPNNLLGAPATAPKTVNEVVEDGSGRVFYVSTDQFGIFRVGKFFTVDQGTGTVTFAASIALSNLDGIGFKRGTVVKEFSTDNTMTDNADDAVPVESAVRGYIDKRLGYTHNGALVALADRIPALTGGFLPVSGTPILEADLSMGSGVGHRITNLVPNIASDSDAANIGYVNDQIDLRDSWYKLKEVLLMTPAAGDIPLFTGAGRTVTTTTLSGDVLGTFTSADTALLATAITGTSQLDVSLGVVVDDLTDWPTAGYFQIGGEIFSYNGITSNTFDDVTRAVGDTVATTHLASAAVLGLTNSRFDLQLQPGVIVNADVSATAAIEQTKLNLTDVTAYVDTATDSVLGKASFSTDNFSVTAGAVTIKDKGIAYAEIQDVAAGSILGNLTGAAASIQEVTTSGIVENGVNSLFTTLDTGSSVMTRRANSLKTTSTFSSISGTPVSGSGTVINLPVTSVSTPAPSGIKGQGAIVTVSYDTVGGYTAITVTYGGNGYTEGEQLIVPGSYFPSGVDGEHDAAFTVATTGSNIDTVVYLGLERVTKIAEANSLVMTDSSKNLGTAGNKFNNVHATTFYGNLTGASVTADVTGDVTGTADSATNLTGGTIGSIPYQSAVGVTTLLAAGTSGRYLKTQGPGVAPVWNEIIIPDGAADTLTGTTLATGVVNSSLTSVGTLTALTVSGNLTIATNKLTVNSTSGAVGINNNLTVGGNLAVTGLSRVSVANAVLASGIDQTGATLLESNINVVTSVGVNTGVRLPDSVAGLRIIIKNAATNNLFIYPSASARINDKLLNEPVILEPDAALEYFCSTSAVGGAGGQWYTINATFA
jgi:hypothetical protein